jgi:multidrug resistance efflux pump
VSDELKAEIAELKHRLDIAAEERHARLGQLERLREAKDTFFRNAEAWEAKYDEAKAELEEWRRDYDRGTRMSDLSAEVRSEINHWRERAEIAEAEIARLHQAYRDEAQLRVALKLDTGE